MAAVELCGRLAGLAHEVVLGHGVAVASGPRTRLLGLVFLARECAGAGLLIPRCRSVHTFGMRFDLDIHFLDAAGQPTSVHRALPPNRLVWDRRAVAALELPSE